MVPYLIAPTREIEIEISSILWRPVAIRFQRAFKAIEVAEPASSTRGFARHSIFFDLSKKFEEAL